MARLREGAVNRLAAGRSSRIRRRHLRLHRRDDQSRFTAVETRRSCYLATRRSRDGAVRLQQGRPVPSGPDSDHLDPHISSGGSPTRAFGIGTKHPYAFTCGRPNFTYETADLILPDGKRIHYVRENPNDTLGELRFEHTATPTAFYKSRLRWNGAGWDLTLRDGTVLVFGDERAPAGDSGPVPQHAHPGAATGRRPGRRATSPEVSLRTTDGWSSCTTRQAIASRRPTTTWAGPSATSTDIRGPIVEGDRREGRCHRSHVTTALIGW